MRRSWLLIGVLACACGAATSTVRRSDADRLLPQVLYPMPRGAQWVFDVNTGPEPPTLGIFEVIEADGDRRSIAPNLGNDGTRTRYGDTIEYQTTPEGIRLGSSNRWLLHAPIRDGATWPAMGGRTARVTSIDISADVMAGPFQHCVEVVETGGEDGRTVRTIYCPDVGPAVVESRIETHITLRTVETRAELRSYDANPADED